MDRADICFKLEDDFHPWSASFGGTVDLFLRLFERQERLEKALNALLEDIAGNPFLAAENARAYLLANETERSEHV